jgi:hypothetical protein
MLARRMAIAACCMAVLHGCSRLTVENFDRIKVGMAYTEVTAILGDPARCSEALTVRSCVWGDEKKHIDINFVGEKVLLKSAENIR